MNKAELLNLIYFIGISIPAIVGALAGPAVEDDEDAEAEALAAVEAAAAERIKALEAEEARTREYIRENCPALAKMLYGDQK
jgi:hypothetical protein